MHGVVLLNLILDNSGNAYPKLSLTCKCYVFQIPNSQIQKGISRFVNELIIKKKCSCVGFRAHLRSKF